MRVLVATDFSEKARTAYEIVRSMELPAGSHVRVVHAVEPITTVHVFAPSALLTINEAAQVDAKALVRRYAKELARPFIESDGVIGLGRAADVIVDEALSFGPDILVVGSRGHGGFASAVLGSVSAEIVDRAPCPVLITRKNTLSSLVLAEDGSVNASAGAHVIRDTPALMGLPLHVVSVVDAAFPTLAIDPGATGASLAAYRAYEEALPALRATHLGFARDRAVALRSAGVNATSEQREGDAGAELIAAAKDRGADCIVIGSRGQTGLQRLTLGSVARSVLFNAPCSVLIVHARRAAAANSNGHTPVAAATSKKEM